jgi:hypothetical protein
MKWKALRGLTAESMLNEKRLPVTATTGASPIGVQAIPV